MAGSARAALRLIALCLAAVAAVALATAPAQAHLSSRRHHHHHHRRHHHRRHHHRRTRRHHHAAAGGSKGHTSGGSSQAPCANADTPATSGTVSEMVAAVDCLVNQQRARFGLPKLNVSSKLDNSAQRWADYLAATGQLIHGNVTGRMTAAGYDWGEGGENIAAQYLTPRDVVAAWMASSEHCQNILDPDFRDVGTGESPHGNNPAAWVQDFGLLMGQNPLSSNYGPANGCPYTIAPSPNPSSSGNPPSPTSPGGWPTSPNSTSSGNPSSTS